MEKLSSATFGRQVPVWDLWVLSQDMPVSRRHRRVPYQEGTKSPRMPEWGAFLCGAISILEIQDLLYSCPISLERKPQIVSLGDKCQTCQTVRNSTRSRGGREANSPGCSGDRSSMTPHFPPCPTSVQCPPAIILSVASR